MATAALNCNISGPSLFFELVTNNPSATVPLNTTAINPCTDSDRTTFQNADFPAGSPVIPNNSEIRAAQVPGNVPYRVDGTEISMRLLNANTNGNGNDAAIDNLQVLDITPQLDKSFDATTVTSSGTAVLTFTATNTDELLAKSGWTFTDTLPAGFEFVAVAAGADACTGTTQVDLSTPGVLNVTAGQLAEGQSSCTIKVGVKVTSPIPAAGQVLVNGPSATAGQGQVTTSYINPPANATVTFLPEADMSATPDQPVEAFRDTPTTVVTICTNNGPDIAGKATCVVSGIPPDAVNPVTTCTPTSGSRDLLVGEKISCETTFTPKTPGTFVLTTTAGSTSSDPVSTNNVAETPVDVGPPFADMKSSSPSSLTGVVGEPVKVTSTCTNLGPDPAVKADCKVTGAPAGAKTVCAPAVPTSAPLEANQSISCETTFTPTNTDPVTLITTASSSTADPDRSNNESSTPVTTKAVATPEPAPVPTNSPWMLSLLGLLMAAPLVRRAMKK